MLNSCISMCLKSIISILCLPVSIIGGSNDAVWFPVYSVLACDDERRGALQTIGPCYCTAGLKFSLSVYPLLLSILCSRREAGLSFQQGEYSTTYRICIFEKCPHVSYHNPGRLPKDMGGFKGPVLV